MLPSQHKTADLFVFTEGILNEEFNYLCTVNLSINLSYAEIADQKILQTH